MSEIERVTQQIKDEIRLDQQGRGFISIRGAARLADVKEQTLSIHFKGDSFSSSKLAQQLTQQGFKPDSFSESGVPDIALSVILGYYAMDAGKRCTEQAKLAYKTFSAIGIRAWMQRIVGQNPGAIETRVASGVTLTPEIIAEIFRLVAKLDALERLSHTISHKRTAITGQLMKLLASHAGQAALNLLDDDDFKSLRRQLKIVGISLEEVCSCVAQARLIPETAKAIKRVVDLGRPSKQAGSLYHYTQPYKGSRLPKVQGERDPNNPNHWYWGLSYVVWDGQQWCDRSMSVSRKALFQVQELLDNEVPIQEILKVLPNRKR